MLQGLGYSGLQASLRSGYPFFAALGLLMITSFISDRYQLRGVVSIFNNFVMLIGFISIAGSPDVLVLANRSDSNARRFHGRSSISRHLFRCHGCSFKYPRATGVQSVKYHRLGCSRSEFWRFDCLWRPWWYHWKLDLPWPGCAILWSRNLCTQKMVHFPCVESLLTAYRQLSASPRTISLLCLSWCGHTTRGTRRLIVKTLLSKACRVGDMHYKPEPRVHRGHSTSAQVAYSTRSTSYHQ